MSSSVGNTQGARPRVVAAIGAFDGLHLGHAKLLHAAKEEALAKQLPLVVFTFSPVPKAVLLGEHFEGSLFPPGDAEKNKILKAWGADYIVTFSFTKDFSEISAEDFMSTHLKEAWDIQSLFVGENFSFGREGKGNVASLQKAFPHVVVYPLLAQTAVASGFNDESVASFITGPSSNLATNAAINLSFEPVSSSAIRKALLAGEIEKAHAFLGRPYMLSGKVVHGKGEGRKLGFPTANIKLSDKQLIPASGVYAARVAIVPDEAPHDTTINRDFARAASHQDISFRASRHSSSFHEYLAAVNIGTAPTFGGETNPYLEAHLLDYSRDLYGKTIQVYLEKKLRDEQTFSSIAELVDTVKLNIDEVRDLLGGGK